MAFLDGDLGLEDAIAKSFSAVSADNKAAKFDPEHTGFSTSLKFVITNSVSAGPNWTLTRFTGPGAELFGFSRTVTHQLLISFTPKGASKELAIGQAQGRNLFMLLQSLRTLPFDRIR
ncbi:MAG TPA: hypothetical protein VEK56_04645 [Vicinamibacterales bacterium]|nr:hypothetical protein [Vicinamibacterales bacterium]